MEAAWHVSIIKKISWYLRLDHICSNASANSMLVISSESWNLRKPSPPWPKEDYYFVGICISKVTKEFETVCRIKQNKIEFTRLFCFCLLLYQQLILCADRRAINKNKSLFCQVKKTEIDLRKIENCTLHDLACAVKVELQF